MNMNRDKSKSGRDELKPVGIWIRVSTEDQAKGESPEHHEKRARMYAEAKGWRDGMIYHQEAVPGKSVLGHLDSASTLRWIPLTVHSLAQEADWCRSWVAGINVRQIADVESLRWSC
jgi:hypothetical protein